MEPYGYGWRRGIMPVRSNSYTDGMGSDQYGTYAADPAGAFDPALGRRGTMPVTGSYGFAQQPPIMGGAGSDRRTTMPVTGGMDTLTGYRRLTPFMPVTGGLSAFGASPSAQAFQWYMQNMFPYGRVPFGGFNQLMRPNAPSAPTPMTPSIPMRGRYGQR